jgi:hypothetical protein
LSNDLTEEKICVIIVSEIKNLSILFMQNRNPEGQEPNNNRRNIILAEIGASAIGTVIAISNLRNAKGEQVSFTLEGVKDWRITVPAIEIFKDPSIVVKDNAILVSPVGVEFTREIATSKTVNATVLHPYNASTKEGSQQLSADIQRTINGLMAQKPDISTSYGGSTMRKYSMDNVQPMQAPVIDKVEIKTTSSGERIENGPKSLADSDVKNVELATQRDSIVREVVQKSVPEGTKILANSGELEFTNYQIERLVQIGKDLKITGQNDLETAFKVLQQVNAGTLKNEEVVDMVGSMRKTEIAVTTTGAVDNIEHIGIPALLPLGILGLTLGTRWAIKNIRMPEISMPTLSCPKPDFRLSCFSCEIPKLSCELPPCVRGVGCCEIPKFDCKRKEKFDLFEPKLVEYDEFLPRHIDSVAVVQKGLDINHIIDMSIARICRLDDRINSRNHSREQMEVEYNQLVIQIANVLQGSNRRFKNNTQARINNTNYTGEIVSNFSAFDYTEPKSNVQNIEYMRAQAKMFIQMGLNCHNRFTTPCFVGARIKVAIRANQMNRY